MIVEPEAISTPSSTESASLGILKDPPVRALAELLLILVNGAALSVAARENPHQAYLQTSAALVAIVEGLRVTN